MRPEFRSLLFGTLLAVIFRLLHAWSRRMSLEWVSPPLVAWMMGGSCVAGSVAWWFLVERRRPMTRFNGTSAGAAAGASVAVGLSAAQIALTESKGPHGIDGMVTYMLLFFAPLAAAFGVMVGAPVGFLYHLLACPRPGKPGAWGSRTPRGAGP